MPKVSCKISGDIAIHNQTAANSLLNRLFDRFDQAASHPMIGVARPDISADARMLVEGRYIAIYRPTDYDVRIVTVVHGMRDPTRWLA
ncbi:type II toxin-antitoxin system RelE/ParE family toxin [Neorhizobium sp. NPDC001467]|uniref:type II toxin-antitoxin system RelE/ParE family toxin n=1 Tax=Neorhizobium sp. NPDC001467 TaxID=3390595 RepID=UPI003D05A560